MTATGDQTKKQDGGKPLMHLLPWTELMELAAALEFGLRKYSEGGWRTVDGARKRYLNAVFRHFGAYADGEKYDLCPEHPTREQRPPDCLKCSGLHHVLHGACSALFLIRFKDDP